MICGYTLLGRTADEMSPPGQLRQLASVRNRTGAKRELTVSERDASDPKATLGG
jgi:hypothetical protein